MLIVYDGLSNVDFVGADVCAFSSKQHVSSCYRSVTSQNTMVVMPGASTYDISLRLLMLSSDIESNPGPTDLDSILEAIKSSENKMLKQLSDSENKMVHKIQSVLSDLAVIKIDIADLKSENQKVRDELEAVKMKANKIDSNSAANSVRVSDLEDISENLRIDVDFLQGQVNAKDDNLKTMRDDIEDLKRQSISDNRRVFGLSLNPDKDASSLKMDVIEKILNIASPNIDWKRHDIKRIKVIPSQENPGSQLIIVTFRYDDDKFRVFSGRDKLREVGIRVGDDLTKHQRGVLRSIRE